MPEARTHWYQTYHAHHINKLKLLTSAYNPCLLYNNNAVITLQTNNTLFLGTPDYVKTKKAELHKTNYLAKPIKKLSANKNLVFNSGIISQDNKAIQLNQEKHYAKIKLIRIDTNFKSAYIQEQAQGAYITSTCQPEATFALSFAA
jgi:hypothetical protein